LKGLEFFKVMFSQLRKHGDPPRRVSKRRQSSEAKALWPGRNVTSPFETEQITQYENATRMLLPQDDRVFYDFTEYTTESILVLHIGTR
jgi:hypothetical protein